MTERTRLHLNRVRWLALPPAEDLHKLVAEHAAITSALRAGDLDGAEAALRAHLRVVLGRVEALRRDHAELFLDER